MPEKQEATRCCNAMKQLPPSGRTACLSSIMINALGELAHFTRNIRSSILLATPQQPLWCLCSLTRLSLATSSFVAVKLCRSLKFPASYQPPHSLRHSDPCMTALSTGEAASRAIASSTCQWRSFTSIPHISQHAWGWCTECTAGLD